MGLLSQETNYFGLDIGATAIRLVQVRSGGAKPALVTYGDVKVPAGLTTSDSTLDREKIAGLVKQLVKDTGVSTKNVVAGLPSQSIFASVITTPKLSQAELAKAIKYQADQYIPMALDQVKLDYAVIGDGPTADEQEVLLVAAPNTAAQKYTEIFEKAGLEVLALEANATAAARALVPPQTQLAVAVLDMSTINSDLTLVYNNAPRLIRTVSVGSTTFIKSVSQNLGLDEEQATQFTYRFGLTQSKLEGQVLKALKPSVDLLVTEVQKSIKFFLSRYQNVKFEKLVLTGTGVALPEFPTHLANQTGLPVEIGNAWINLSYPANMQEQLMGISNDYAVAAGLAERSFL